MPRPTIVPCSESPFYNRIFVSVWGDGTGKIYFVGLTGGTSMESFESLWVYDENTDTLTCEPGITDYLFDVDGRLIEGEMEVWAEAKDKLWRRRGGTWSRVSIPDVDPYDIENDLTMPRGIQVGPGTTIAVWGNWRLGFYDTAAESWAKLAFCPGMESNTVLSGYWIGDIFYLPGGCRLYAVDPAAPDCATAVTFEGCDTDGEDELYATGVVDGELWLAQVDMKSETAGDFGRLIRTILYNPATGESGSHDTPDLTNSCRETLNTESYYPAHVIPGSAPGLAGFPLGIFVTANYWPGAIYPYSTHTVWTALRLSDTWNDSTCEASETLTNLSCASSPPTRICDDGFLFQQQRILQLDRVWRHENRIWTKSNRITVEMIR